MIVGRTVLGKDEIQNTAVGTVGTSVKKCRDGVEAHTEKKDGLEVEGKCGEVVERGPRETK